MIPCSRQKYIRNDLRTHAAIYIETLNCKCLIVFMLNRGGGVFPKFILRVGSCYIIFTTDIFVNLLQNVVLFLKTWQAWIWMLNFFYILAIFYSIFGWQEDDFMLFLHSKKKEKKSFVKSIFDFLRDSILGAQIMMYIKTITTLTTDMKYHLVKKADLTFSSGSSCKEGFRCISVLILVCSVLCFI